MADQEIVIVGADGTEHVFPSGFDPKKAATIVRNTQGAPHGTAIDPNEPSTYAAGVWKGFKEGAAGGAKGFVQGMAESPAALLSGVGTMLTQSPVTTLKDTAAAIGRLPAAVRGAGSDPEGFGRDVGNITGQTMIGMAAPKVPAMAGAVGRGAMRAGAAAADIVSPEAVGIVSPRMGHVLRVVQKMRDATSKVPSTAASRAGPPRLAGKAPTLTDSLTTILDELHQDAVAERGGTSPSATGAALGGEQAATSSMRMLAEKPDLKTRFARTMSYDEASPIYRATDFTKPTRVKVPVSKLVATQEGFQNPIIERYQVHPGSELPSASQVGDEYILNDGHHRALAQMANGATEIEVNAHPVDPVLAKNPQPRATWLDRMTPAKTRAGERFGKVYTSEGELGRPAPVPLSEAVSAVRDAAPAAKVKLTAAEFEAATKLVQRGRPAADVLDAITAQRALRASPSFAELPTNAEVEDMVATKNAEAAARSTNPRYGAKQGDYGRKPDTGTNPFR